MRMNALASISALLAGLGVSGVVLAQGAALASSDGVYTSAQAKRGKAFYDAQCAICHGGALSGIDVAPALAGLTFRSNWKGLTAAELFTRIRQTMPVNAPGSLTSAQSADITAYILKSNSYPAGTAELPSSTSALRSITLD